ncbi:MAG: hypothetical protein ABS79_02275 [Planctomycetes bacterium SCN 63-9]|nr:MAG: hypothetical protein ABS79_02275 [Planctomycetes bacterium SCN 63-9]
MAEDLPVVRCRVPIANALGLHLRPAGAFARLAQTYQSEVWVAHQQLRVNGKSVLDLMTLGAAPGMILEIEVQGPDAAEALAALANLVASGFDFDEGDEA